MDGKKPPRLFVSHPSTKAETALHIERALKDRGVDCWIAPRDIEPGEQWDVAIRHAIAATDAMLLLFCADSERSKQVKRELILADNSNKAIIPMRLERIEPHELSYHLADSQWIDWIEQRDEAIDRIAAKAREFQGGPPAPPPVIAQTAPAPLASVERTGANRIPLLAGGVLLAALLAFGIWWFALRNPGVEVAAPATGGVPASASAAKGASEPAAPAATADTGAAAPVTAAWFAGVWGQEMPCLNHYRFDRSGALTDPNGVGGRWQIAEGVLTKELGGSTHRLPLTRVGEDEVATPEGPLYRRFAGAT